MFKKIILSALVAILALNTPKSIASNDIINLVDSLLDETHATMLNVDINKTIELSSKALSLSIDAKYNAGMIRSYYIIGQALFHNQSYNEALSYLVRAEKVKDFKKYPLYMTQIYKVKGQIYFYLKLNQKAIKEFHRALEVVNKVERSDHREYLTSQIYECFITLYNSESDHESSFKYLTLAKDLLESSQNESFIYPNKINFYSLLGEYHYVKNEYEQAKAYLGNAMDLIYKYEFNYKSFALRIMGDVLVKEAKYREALDSYLEALHSATELGLKSELVTLYKKTSETYQLLNMTDSASYYENKKIYAENELLKEKVGTTDNVLQTILDDEKMSNRRRVDWTFRIAILVTLIVSVVVVRAILRKKHKKIIEGAEAETHILKQKLNVAFDEVMELAKKNDPSFLVRFSEVYPNFYNKFVELHPDLTATDLKLCAMTYLNIPTVDIAKYTFVENRTVQTRRSRLRKKINLDSDIDFFDFLKEMDK